MSRAIFSRHPVMSAGFITLLFTMTPVVTASAGLFGVGVSGNATATGCNEPTPASYVSGVLGSRQAVDGVSQSASCTVHIPGAFTSTGTATSDALGSTMGTLGTRAAASFTFSAAGDSGHAFAAAQFVNTITLDPPKNANPNDFAHVRFGITVDGSITGTTTSLTPGSDAYGVSGKGSATAGVTVVVDPGPGEQVFSNAGGVTDATGAVHFQVSVPVVIPDAVTNIELTEFLNAAASVEAGDFVGTIGVADQRHGEADVELGHTGQAFLELPPGWTFTSASGDFLSAPPTAVPEPGILMTTSLGLLVMLSLRRRSDRRRADDRCTQGSQRKTAGIDADRPGSMMRTSADRCRTGRNPMTGPEVLR